MLMQYNISNYIISYNIYKISNPTQNADDGGQQDEVVAKWLEVFRSVGPVQIVP